MPVPLGMTKLIEYGVSAFFEDKTKWYEFGSMKPFIPKKEMRKGPLEWNPREPVVPKSTGQPHYPNEFQQVLQNVRRLAAEISASQGLPNPLVYAKGEDMDFGTLQWTVWQPGENQWQWFGSPAGEHECVDHEIDMAWLVELHRGGNGPAIVGYLQAVLAFD